MMPTPQPDAAEQTKRSSWKQTAAEGWAALLRSFSNRTESSQFNRRMTIVVATLFACDVVLAALFHLNPLEELKLIAELFVTSPGMVLLIGACWYCRWRGEAGLMKMGDFAQLAAWTLLVIPAISYLIPVAGRSPFPLVDGALSRIDAAMHFQTSTFVQFVAHRTRLR